MAGLPSFPLTDITGLGPRKETSKDNDERLRDHFELQKVTVSNPNFGRNISNMVRYEFNRSKTFKSSPIIGCSDYTTAICTMFPSPKSEVHSLNENWASNFSYNGQKKKIDNLHIHSRRIFQLSVEGYSGKT
jgi:hypothetical protein